MKFLHRITPLVLTWAIFWAMCAVAGAQLAMGNLNEASAAGGSAVFLMGGFALGQADRDERARTRSAGRREYV